MNERPGLLGPPPDGGVVSDRFELVGNLARSYGSCLFGRPNR